MLNQQIAALRRQLGALEAALEISEKRERDSQTKIADLGQRLNVALAQRVQELQRYRSDFFGRLRQILGSRPDVRIVGEVHDAHRSTAEFALDLVTPESGHMARI